MFIRDDVNDYGTPITVHGCDTETCGREFTVCPAVPADMRDQWDHCLDEDCESYEPMRDADLYFSLDMVKFKPSG
jgi:hypothetical protein